MSSFTKKSGRAIEVHLSKTLANSSAPVFELTHTLSTTVTS